MSQIQSRIEQASSCKYVPLLHPCNVHIPEGVPEGISEHIPGGTGQSAEIVRVSIQAKQAHIYLNIHLLSQSCPLDCLMIHHPLGSCCWFEIYTRIRPAEPSNLAITFRLQERPVLQC